MTLRRWAATAAIAAGLAVSGAAPAFADDPYPPPPPPPSPTATAPVPVPGIIGLSTTRPKKGSDFALDLPSSSCDPGSTVTETVDGEVVDTGKADGDGAYSDSAQIDDVGAHTILVTCNKSGVAVAYSTRVNVVSKNSGSNSNGSNGSSSSGTSEAAGGLAGTGAENALTIAAIGGGLIVVGGFAVFMTRRRGRPIQ